MANRQSNLQERFIKDIADGKKTVEGRMERWLLCDGKETSIGDIIEWKCKTEIIKTKIIDIVKFKSFEDMYADYGEKLLPGDVELSNGKIKIYDDIYGKEIKDDSVMIAIILKLL